DAPGRVLIRPGKVELGQGIATALAQVAADTLGLPVSQIDVAPVDTDHSPDEGVTAGSQSVELSGTSLRLAGLAARKVLLDAVAAKLGVPAETISASGGRFLANGVESGEDYWSVAG